MKKHYNKLTCSNCKYYQEVDYNYFFCLKKIRYSQYNKGKLCKFWILTDINN
jgi:hypothetical protein